MISEEQFNHLQYSVDPTWNPQFLADDDTYRSRSVGARLSENTHLVDIYFQVIRRCEPFYSEMNFMDLINNVEAMSSVVWDPHIHGKLMNELCIANKVKRNMHDLFVHVATTVENEKCRYEGKFLRDINFGYKYTTRDVLQQAMYRLECSIPLECLNIVQFKKPLGRKRKKTDFVYRSLDDKYYDDDRELDLNGLYLELNVF